MSNIIEYRYFVDKLNNKIKADEDFYYELLQTVVKSPKRYIGVFRISNVQTKLVQNVTQSREIKFGDFMEDIVTEYLEKTGYLNYDKNIGNDEEGNALSADQVFGEDDTVYLVEQKIRDDHDSTKKRGQYENFRKKYTLLKTKYKDKKIVAVMWFIDPGLKKNKKYYFEEASHESLDVEIHISYGAELFYDILNKKQVWDELYAYLQRNKLERNNEVLEIPDFDKSEEMLFALKRLRLEEPKLFEKLKSNTSYMKQLRQELFPTGCNISAAMEVDMK